MVLFEFQGLCKVEEWAVGWLVSTLFYLPPGLWLSSSVEEREDGMVLCSSLSSVHLVGYSSGLLELVETMVN
jgi:hypothetical protein